MLRILAICLGIAAAAAALWLGGQAIFDAGGSAPGSGTGETVTLPKP